MLCGGISIKLRLDKANNMINYIECDSCQGVGYYSIGDCEDGVDETCEECGGEGVLEDSDVFVPERDAWGPND